MKPRLLLLLPTTSYRIDAFLEAANRAGADVIAACDHLPALPSSSRDSLIRLDFLHPESAAREASRIEPRIDAVLGVDDTTAGVAAAIAEALDLRPRNPVPAVEAAANKARLREALREAGVPAPSHQVFSTGDDPARAARAVTYPCVLKPLILSASRGVVRAGDPEEFSAAFRRIVSILDAPEIRARGDAARRILAEDFVPGAEVAIEGLLFEDRLHVLAIFDKPDPLEGPYFEETIYVTPSRLARETQEALATATESATRALGLREGAVHAELRVGPSGPSVIEVAARSIGGLCAKVLRFEDGSCLEDLLVRHALRKLGRVPAREERAAAVMMIPIPRRGELCEVLGRERAAGVPLIEEVTITAHPGMELVPPPEGSRYLGFIFARGERPEEVERALRSAHAMLDFVIEPHETARS